MNKRENICCYHSYMSIDTSIAFGYTFRAVWVVWPLDGDSGTLVQFVWSVSFKDGPFKGSGCRWKPVVRTTKLFALDGFQMQGIKVVEILRHARSIRISFSF